MYALEEEMATHSSILALKTPGTEEPGGLLSVGSHRVGHDWSNLAAAAARSFFSASQIDNYLLADHVYFVCKMYAILL